MKKWLSAVMALAMILTLALSFPLPASAESLYIRKVVSVVYDDSGSMLADNRYVYANYALQTLCGMLNSEDELYITFMNHGGTQQMDLSTGGIQGAVDSIRTHQNPVNNDGTPFDAVYTAFDILDERSKQDTNPNTQYWLVVIADGAFKEMLGMTVPVAQRWLDEAMRTFVDDPLDNGSYAQVTFLSIGDLTGTNVLQPTEDLARGIYSYNAKNATEIVNVMGQMADRISGRTRLDSSAIRISGNIIEISSAIPLMNIAVLTQNTGATIEKVEYSNETEIPVSRSAAMSRGEDATLRGNAYLIGDTQNVIGAGTYRITFTDNVDANNVSILFEPALEMRMTVTVNGRVITDYSELDDVHEGDVIDISCKIYEMGTDNEVSSSLLPPGTTYNISITEDGQVVQSVDGDQMLLSGYTLRNIGTKIAASMRIPGFNPITFEVSFTPGVYVPPVVYTMTAAFGSDVKSVKFDEIASNQDLTICFTVYADGEPVTDPEIVRGFSPVITASPQGNSGVMTIADDGTIVFTPNSASVVATSTGSFNVDVTCTLSNGVSAGETYTVLISDYRVVPVSPTETVKKTGLFDNQVGVSFYITKDGVQMGKADVENGISILLNDAHSTLKVKTSVAADGTITVVPYSEETKEVTFGTWWFYWSYYFSLSGDDVAVTLSHPYGSAEATIDIVQESVGFQLLNVYLPLTIEVIALALLITWIVLIVIKPRYTASAKLYVGDIKFDKTNSVHVLRNFRVIQLDKFNAIKRGNGRLKFKTKADVVSAGGIQVRADRGGRIFCEMGFPWYKGKVEPEDSNLTGMIKSPADLVELVRKLKKLQIHEITPTNEVKGDYERALAPANPKTGKYIIIPTSSSEVANVDGRKVIKSGKLFIYVNG